MGKRKRASKPDAKDRKKATLVTEEMGVDGLLDAIGSLVHEEGAQATEENGDAQTSGDDGADDTEDAEDVDPTEEEFSLASHRDQLAKLKEMDPEFFEYLSKNDADLLDFGNEEDDEDDGDGAGDEEGDVDIAEEGEEEGPLDDDDSDDDDNDDEDDDDVENVADGDEPDTADVDGAPESEQDAIILTLKSVRELEESLAKRPREARAASKNLLRAFRSGCHLTETTKQRRKRRRSENPDDGEDADGIGDGTTFGGDVKFSSPRVYQRVMTVSVVKLMSFLSVSAGRKEGAKPDWRPSADGAKWRKVQPLIRSFASNFCHLLGGITDGATIRFLLKRAELLLPLLTKLPKQARELVRCVSTIWASESVNTPTRVRAYLLLHRAASNLSDEYLELVLKSVVKAYREHIANRCNVRQLARINFAVQCINELCGVDLSTTYTTAFVAIREIAMALRTALISKGKEELGKVYNWEVVNSLRLWSKVLASYPGTNELRLLIYPFSQVTLGIMRLVPSPRNYGLRFHCARYLIDVMEASGVYVPVAPAMLEALNCKEVLKGKGSSVDGSRKGGKRVKKTGKGADAMLDWRTLLRVPESALKSKAFRDGVVQQSLFVIALFLSTLSRCVALPEVAFPTLSGLRKFAKASSTPYYSKQARQLVKVAENSCQMTLMLRSKLDMGARGVADFSCKESPLKFPGAHTPLEELASELAKEMLARDKLFQDDNTSDAKAEHTEENDDDESEEIDTRQQDMEKAADRPLLLKGSGTDADGSDEDVVEDLELSDSDREEDEADD